MIAEGPDSIEAQTLTYLRRVLQALEDEDKKFLLAIGKIGSGSHG